MKINRLLIFTIAILLSVSCLNNQDDYFFHGGGLGVTLFVGLRQESFIIIKG